MLRARGVDGLSVKEVAATAGVNEASIYRRWRTRENLMLDALLSVPEDVVAVPDTGSLRADLLTYVGSIRAWLLTVARNIVTDRARARAVRPLEVAELDEHRSVGRDHSDAVVNTLLILDALNQVSVEHREVLQQLYYQGRTVAETAQQLGVPLGTIKSRSYHALRAARAAIAPQEGK